MNRPWMPLYVADYRADTAHLNAAQHGAYLLLIMHYWQTGELPIDDAPLARIACMTPAEWRKTKPVIASFFTSNWRHKRIDRELARMVDVSNKRRAAAEQRHSKRVPIAEQEQSNSDANAEQMDTHSHSHSQRKEDTADAVPTAYEFESGVIRLTASDFEKWKKSFSYLDLPAELLSLTEWAGTQPKWFFAVSGALAKRNREAKAARESPQGDANKQYWGNRIPGIS